MWIRRRKLNKEKRSEEPHTQNQTEFYFGKYIHKINMI